MISLDYDAVKIENLITHHVGNKLNDENVVLSNQCSEVKDETLTYLLNYFLSSFNPVEFYEFTHTVNIEMNEVYTIVKQMFEDETCFIDPSKNLAKLLYECSDHPKVKPGEFNLTYFKNIRLGGEPMDAVGIFKSETDVPFLKMNEGDSNYEIEHEFGFELKGIDKACLIFNLDQDTGYKILIVDNASKGNEAQYWVNDFLELKPRSDGYSKTKNVMNIAKNFVTNQMSDEFVVSKTEKIDLLNKTVDYFKNNESFNKAEFEENVFQDENVISSFRRFDDDYRAENEVEKSDDFNISDSAVKKEARKFKSILKLDKNFHVYIHGDKKLIEKGVESDGRKFYKIYYENED